MYDNYDADYLAVKDNMTKDMISTSREFDAAMEGYISDIAHWKNEAATDEENDPQAPGAAQAALAKFQEIMKKAFDKLQNLIGVFAQKLKNFANRMILTDRGYKKMIREAEVNRKPLKAIKVIMYEYNPDAVFDILKKFDSVMDDVTNLGGSITDIVKRKDNLLALPADQLESTILEKLNLPESITSFDQLMIYIRKIFHGKKSERTILAAELPEWLRRASKTEGVQQLINNTVGPKQARVNQLKKVFLNTSLHGDIPDSARSLLLRMTTNAGRLYGKYASIATQFFDLYLEYVVAARVITKRFYQL